MNFQHKISPSASEPMRAVVSTRVTAGAADSSCREAYLNGGRSLRSDSSNERNAHEMKSAVHFRLRGESVGVAWRAGRASESNRASEHFGSLHEINCTNRRSVASRFLAVGILLAPPLRCSTCQGRESLTQISVRLPHLHPKQCNARTPQFASIQALLRDRSRLSHAVIRTVAVATNSAVSASKKNVNSPAYARIGAEGQHIAYLAGRY